MSGTKRKSNQQEQPLTFEQALGNLETIVEQLENGELPLAEALAQFEQGIHYSRFCHSILNEMDQKINLLLEEHDGVLSTRPLDLER